MEVTCPKCNRLFKVKESYLNTDHYKIYFKPFKDEFYCLNCWLQTFVNENSIPNYYLRKIMASRYDISYHELLEKINMLKIAYNL